MTLFTANGLLMGLTRHYMRGTNASYDDFVKLAYLDWYYTQTGEKDDEHAHTWLRDLPEMAYRRAPGNTCLEACRSLSEGKEVQNDSMGCGGIMRIAPIALLKAKYTGEAIDSIIYLAANVAMCTHKHPLGYMPAVALALLLYNLTKLSADEASRYIDKSVAKTMEYMDYAAVLLGFFYSESRDKIYRAYTQIKEVTDKVMRLAHSNISDEEAIKQLGEGWVALEAWAIALYCAVRHIDSIEDAIIAAVNHDGDSDSTGSICGNIMGVIYGYEHIKERNIFCPEGAELEQTLELSEVILALADDLSSECPIGEYMQIERPEQIQWLLRYCEMEPAGIGENK
jgi:ADP-ribosylglycohydrolase